MERLRPDDHFLILLEGDETPMHIGSLLVLDVPTEYRTDAADRLRSHLIDRLPNTPLLRELRRSPLGFDSDVWVRPEHVDLDRHIVIHRTESPMTRRDLSSFVEQHVMTRLAMERPPFKIDILDGVEPNGIAMYVRIHHCVADGVGFQTILGLLSDDSPAGDANVSIPDDAGGTPTRHEWLQGALDRFRAERAGQADHRAARRSAIDALRDPAFQRAETPTISLSGPTSTRRSYTTVTIPFDQLRQTARSLDATLNDLFLAIAGTTMRNYLIEIDDLPDTPLTTNSARSYRRAEHGAFGNRIVAIHPHLATHIADPLERLRAIQASMAIERRRTGYDEAMLNQPESPFGPAVRRRRFAERRESGASVLPGNVTVSNVPGPKHARSYAGFTQLSNHPTPLLGSGRALNFTARRNANSFDVGVMVDADKIGDVDHIAGFFQWGYTEYALLAEREPTEPTHESDR